MSKVGVHWFRYGLRLHDNAPLRKAISSCSTLIPLYIIDTDYFTPSSCGINRMGFLLDSLKALDEDLREKGSKLFVATGNPCEVLRAIIQQNKVEILTFERDTEPYNRAMDESVFSMAASLKIDVSALWGHTMFDPEYLLSLNNGTAPLTMTSFLKLMYVTGHPPKPLDAPDKVTPPPEGPLGCEGVHLFPNPPSLEDLNKFNFKQEDKSTWFVAGEKEAMQVMEKFFAQKRRTANFEKPKTSPTALEPDTTALSPYMSRGSLSSRLFYHRLKDTVKDFKNASKPPVSLQGQLYWREMAYLIGFSTPNFNQMKGNPICKQIPWQTGPEAKVLLEKWEAGQTGFPAVDAVMNQLKTEGWMHHLARHLVACFLTRGDLWVSWEMGRDVFDKHLVDADWSINNFSWHWLSCSAFFHQYFRCYSPIAFFKKTDPNGAYIKKHVPILSKFPAKYIYEPWTAPKATQEACGCVIGKDYPKPMVDHSTVNKINMGKMKNAYDAAKPLGGKKRATDGKDSPAKRKQSTLSNFSKKK